MAETIRDVVIRIRVQQQDVALKPPDMSAWKAATQQANQERKQSASLALTAEEEEAIASYSRIMKEREKIAAATQAAIEKSLQNSLSDDTGLPQSSRTDSRTELQGLSVTKQRIEAYTAMGESALRAARGVAFLTAANEEDLRASLQYVAAAQGVLDVFAGVMGVTKSLISVRQVGIASTVLAAASEAGLATASATSAASGTALAASNAAVATSATAASAATNTLTASLLANPITAAVVAVIAAGAAAWYLYSSAAKAAAESEAQLEEARRNRIQAEEEQRRDTLDSQRSEYEERFRLEKELGALSAKTIEDRKFALNDQLKAAERIGFIQNRKDDSTPDLDYRAQLASFQAQVSVRKEAASLYAEETQQLQKQLELTQGILNNARQQVETAKQAVATDEERYGRLSKLEQNRLREINTRLGAGGKLTESDAALLDKTGFGKEQTSAFFRQKGQDAGGIGAISGLTTSQQQLRDATNELRAMEASAGAAQGEILDALAQIQKAADENAKQLAQRLKDTFVTNEQLKKVLAELDRLKKDDTAKKLQNP